MLKLGKGLKKKKKNKKGKKDQELFTEEELEKYRQEHAHKVVEVDEAGPSEESKPPPNSEEFQKFKLLTAGVDDILRKSQGDLDRIKKDSFFQRKPTPSEIKAQEEKEKAELEKSEGNWVGFGEKGEKVAESDDKGEEFHFEEDSGSEFEVEDTDDIFDTAYVDVLESGDVKLVYVPDDEEFIVDDGPDPFDTSTADELLRKAEEEERKKKKEIKLGLAVNVLSGRAERDRALLEGEVETKEVKKTRVRPRKIQDLCLLGSFDESSKPEADAEENSGPHTVTVDVPKSLLDDEVDVDQDLPEGDILTQVLINPKPPPPELATPVETGEDLNNLVLEFDHTSFVNDEIKKLEEEEEFDEFSALAASSVVNQKLEQELHQYEVAEDDPFDTSVVDAVLQIKSDPFASIEGFSTNLPPVEVPKVEPTGWSSFDEDQKETDPFDTTFAEGCKPGKAELRLLEKEILETTIVQTVSKKIDVHLEARILSRNNSEDFNPREGEEKAKSQRQRVSIQITNPSGETQRGSESEDIVALNLSHRDLLGGSTTDLSSLGDQPLPPSASSPGEELSRYSDPFDTSLVDQVAAPGKAELRFIEKELLSDINKEDDDFDPRVEEKGGNRGVSFDIPSPIGPDLLSSVKEESGVRPLTPFYAEALSAESDFDSEDPFDTSHVTHLPGKQELRLLEQELEQVPSSPPIVQPLHEKLGIASSTLENSNLKHSTSDQEFNPRADESPLKVEVGNSRRFSDISGLRSQPPRALPLRSSFSEDKPDLLAVEEELPDKLLTPSQEEDLSAYIDPFDTSIAENIAPGKAELKILEVELVGSISTSINDQDFDPRKPVAPKLKTVASTKPLTPLEVTEDITETDPFDTSIANNIAPGKAELRILESELVG